MQGSPASVEPALTATGTSPFTVCRSDIEGDTADHLTRATVLEELSRLLSLDPGVQEDGHQVDVCWCEI